MRCKFFAFFMTLPFCAASVASDFVTLQCSGERQTIQQDRKAQAIFDALGKSHSTPFSQIYKIKFDENDPVVMIMTEDKKFVVLEGGKSERHSVYECKSSEFDIKCNFVQAHKNYVSSRDLTISRVDGALSSGFSFLGPAGFSTIEKGVCKKFDEGSVLF